MKPDEIKKLHFPINKEKVRILVMDSDEEQLEITKSIFSTQGYRVEGVLLTLAALSRINNFNPHIIVAKVKEQTIKEKSALSILQHDYLQTSRVIIFSELPRKKTEQLVIDLPFAEVVYKEEGLLRLISRVNFHIYMRLSDEELRQLIR